MHGKPHKSELTQSYRKQSRGFERIITKKISYKRIQTILYHLCVYVCVKDSVQRHILFRNITGGDEHKIYIRR